MNILFLNHNLIWRGTFFRCFGLARELARLGHSIDLWTVSREPNLIGTRRRVDGVRIWQTPRWGPLGNHDGGYALIDNCCRLMNSLEGQWDIIHAFDHRPNVLVPWMLLRLRLRVLNGSPQSIFLSDWCDWWTGGGITSSRRCFQWIDRIEQRIEEGSKVHSDGVTVIGSTLYDRALQAGVAKNRLLDLPFGAALDRFPMLDRGECRRRIGLAAHGPVLGFAGFSFWDLKLLAEAFHLIKQADPATVLLVVGGGVEDKAKDIFYSHFTVGRDVLLPGVVPFDQIPLYLGACDIQLMPMENTLANRARLPNKLCDYFASGRPSVVSDVGDAATLVRRYQTGLIADDGPEPFAQTCLKLIHNPELAASCGLRARQLVEGELSYGCLSRKLVDFYRHLRDMQNINR